MRNVAENGRTVKAVCSLTFLAIFASFSKIEKVAENGGKVKAMYSLSFLLFLLLYEK